jgi:hypothetical protein
MLLNLLANFAFFSDAQKGFFLFWRTWHHHNNMVHGYTKASIVVSTFPIKLYGFVVPSFDSSRGYQGQGTN